MKRLWQTWRQSAVSYRPSRSKAPLPSAAKFRKRRARTEIVLGSPPGGFCARSRLSLVYASGARFSNDPLDVGFASPRARRTSRWRITCPFVGLSNLPALSSPMVNNLASALPRPLQRALESPPGRPNRRSPQKHPAAKTSSGSEKDRLGTAPASWCGSRSTAGSPGVDLAGVEFIDENDGGLGILLQKPQQKKGSRY
jgi:hypothetical protein